jgi:hypothetical protein
MSAAQQTPGPWRLLPVMGGGVMATRWTRAPNLSLCEERFSGADGSWLIFPDIAEAHAVLAEGQEGES